jgi:hypothetical protein
MDPVRDRIEQCAARILVTLGEIGSINVLRLSEQLGEMSVLTYQALGWLAREERIRYERRGNQVYVSLAAVEQATWAKHAEQHAERNPIDSRRKVNE